MHTHTEGNASCNCSINIAIPAPSISSVEVTRLNMTTFNLSASLAYTGGGVITHFRVSFQNTGTTPWTPPENIPVIPSPNSNLVWSGVLNRNEFAASPVEFMLSVTNQHGFESNSIQTEEESGKSNTVLLTACTACAYFPR